jgi:hypothetical protein
VIAQILSLCVAASAPADHHSIADMICPAGAVSCVATLPDWVYRVQAPMGDGQGWAAFGKQGSPLPWRYDCSPGKVPDTLLLPSGTTETDSGWVWDAQGRFPVVGAFVGLDTPGASGKIALEAKDSVDKIWHNVAVQSCWNALRDGRVVRQDTLRLAGQTRHRFWRIRPIESRATIGSTPRLVLLVLRDRVEVATGGADTLLWGAGSGVGRMADPPPFPQSIPVAPGQGRIGAPRIAAGVGAWAVPIPTRTWVLWTSLVVFLAGLAYLATKLLRQAFAAPVSKG